MSDGKTVRLTSMAGNGGIESFTERYRARIVIVSGRAAGVEWEVARDRLTLGRGPGVDAVLDSTTVSRQHAAVEYAGGRFRIVDLDSTNGIVRNGERVKVADLFNGDRVEIGDQIIQFVIEERETEPETFELPAQD
jgi:pSer/pThr/pTyr-binding forkhead associated (FHA) protein